MIQIFKTEDGAVHQIDEIEPNSWIALTDPTAARFWRSRMHFRLIRIR